MTESNVSGRRDPMEWIMVDTIEIGSSARAHHFRHLGAHMAASWSRHDAELHIHQATHCPCVPLLQMIDKGLFPTPPMPRPPYASPYRTCHITQGLALGHVDSVLHAYCILILRAVHPGILTLLAQSAGMQGTWRCETRAGCG
jgi:hypothetical protein